MTSIAEYLADDHQHCDRLFAAAENDVGARDWNRAEASFQAFRNATLTHFAREEEALFPAFEAATGVSGGPTQVMRMEHAQMRDTLAAMADALARRDEAVYLGLSETMLMLMRQHNMKEERILYPIAEQTLDTRGASLVEEMRSLG